MRWTAAYAAVGLVLSGCSAASHGSAASTTTPTTSPTTTSRPGGLIGVIDAARVAAVCANVRQAQTVMAGGMDATAAESLRAAADLLARPPVDPTAATAAASIRTAVRTGHDDAAVSVGLAFCRTHGGG